MDSNTDSTGRATRLGSGSGRPDRRPELDRLDVPDRLDGLAVLAAAVDGLAAQDLDGCLMLLWPARCWGCGGWSTGWKATGSSSWRRRGSRGAAGAEVDQAVGSTAAWLRSRLRLGASAAASSVRTARALFGGSLAGTAEALTGGVLSPAHARVLAAGTHELPPHITAEAEPVLLKAARRPGPTPATPWGIC